jgi:hypothetical protein
MAAWLPALKALLPYATQIVTAAIPAFTRKTGSAQDVIPEQIQELQGAVIHNAEAVKMLATQMQQVITSIDSGALKIEHDMRTVKRLSIIAIVLSVVAIALCIASWAVNAG